MALGDSVLNRCDDSHGTISHCFAEACAAIGPLALKARIDPLALADRVFAALNAGSHGQFSPLIAITREALGRPAEAQHMRLDCFTKVLSADHLRAYLKRLPDFDDVIAEDKALDQVLDHENRHGALGFLIDWPALERAARLVMTHYGELDGNYYETLTAAADALAGKYPLAATLLLRRMINFALDKARSSRYRHAARHLLECASLSAMIDDFGRHENHQAYEARLRREHGRKSGFWSLVT